MELIDLRLFERIAQEGSISRAAASMQMAQSAVSSRLQALEEAVGRPLCERHRRGVTLTEAGERFLAHAMRSLALLDEGIEAVRSMAPERVRIALAGPSSVLGYFAGPLLAKLASAGHDLTAKDAHSQDVIRLLLTGEIHAGFVLGANAQPGICQEPIARDPIIAVAASSHPLAKASSLGMADLKGQTIAFYAFSRELPTFRERLAAAIGGAPQGVQKIAPVEAARALALTGAFITFVPRLTVRAELESGALVTLPIADLPSYHWTISLAYRERKVEEPAVSLTREATRSLWPSPPEGADR